MWALIVVEREVLVQALYQLNNRRAIVQVEVLILDGAPEPLYQDVVQGPAAAISGYIGKGVSLAKAIADFAAAYADQTEQDHQSLVDAIEPGRVVAETGI